MGEQRITEDTKHKYKGRKLLIFTCWGCNKLYLPSSCCIMITVVSV